MKRTVILLLAAMIGVPDALPAHDPDAVSATRQALKRIRKIDPRIHAVLAVDPTALDQARAVDAGPRRFAPLAGIPVLIKDNIETAGPLPTTAGSLALQLNVTGRDAPLVTRLRNAGAIIVGKANLSEWANIRASQSVSGWSAVGGQTRNPHALNRNPCGSSSGSAAAVAAGLVPVAIGTETDGSITCPASTNGVVGFKPTVGLVSRSRIIPISRSQDTAGPLTRTVREAALIMNVIAGSDPADAATREADSRKADYTAALSTSALRGKRIGVMRFASGFGTDDLFEQALATLKGQGAELVEIKSLEGMDQIGRDEITVLLTELKADLNSYLATAPSGVTTRSLQEVMAFNQANAASELAIFGQNLFEQAQKTKGLDDPDYRKARADSFRRAGPDGIDRLLRDKRLDALIGPTMPPAWPIDVVNGDQISGAGAGQLAAVAGYPHLSVPMGTVKGMPVGLSFIGTKWSDPEILALGYAYEQASRKMPSPRLLKSIEDAAEMAPLLIPAKDR